MPIDQIHMGPKIGSGAFCDVHEATPVDANGHPAGPKLAIKLLKPEIAAQEELLARFQREVRLLDYVLSHPNIITVVVQNVASETSPWYAMPLAETTLHAEIEAGKWKDEDWVIETYLRILEGAAYAHVDKKVIHRDLKPKNILIDGGVVKITDFGLGKALEAGTAGLTKTNHWFGTEPYMAPEQFTDMKDAGAEADVFSLGKILMKMLTGRTPLVGVPNVSPVPERFRYFVQRCCAEKPENRYPDARAALEAFNRIVRDPVFAELPSETLERLVEDWWGTPAESDEEEQVVRWIDEHLRTSFEDEALYLREVPRLPEELLDRYMERMPAEFALMIGIYDQHVSGALPFEYCDLVTDFYERIFRETPDLALKDLLLRRLFRMGKAHNRWHVRGRVMAMLSEADDPSTVALAADVIREEAEHSDWTAEIAEHYVLPKAIQEAFDSIA